LEDNTLVMKMNVILLGSPGVGKGTYAGHISKKLNIDWISTGDIFRENIKNQTELGKKADDYIKQGKLVPDELTIQMTLEELKKHDNFMLDGFPRTVPQAESLKDTKIDKVLNFVASEKTIIERLSGRRICRKCGAIFHIKNIPTKEDGICDNCSGETYQRDDDKPEAIKERLEVYKKKTEPLINYYKEKGLLVEVDANSPVPQEIVSTAIKILTGE